MKNTVRALIDCCIITAGVLLIIHRRVISALVTGEPMPDMPEWHKKCFGCLKCSDCTEKEEER